MRTRHVVLLLPTAGDPEDVVLVFSGDGGPYHPNIVRAAKNADILVTETAYELLTNVPLDLHVV